MQEILKEIKDVGAVIGSYVYIKGINETISDLPKIFLKKITDVEETVDRVIKVNESTKMQANNIEITYDEATILIKPIDNDSALITFCETKADKKLVNMTSGMLGNDIQKAIEAVRKGETAAPAPEEPAAPPEPQEEAATIDVNKIIHGGPLAKTMQGFQDALAMAIGPIGDMVMKDTVKEWATDGECSSERLPDLVDRLCVEIDDKSLETEFRQAVAALMN